MTRHRSTSAAPATRSLEVARLRPDDRTTVLHWHTMVEGLDWLPEDGVVLTRGDLERIFSDLRALIDGTGKLDANRAHAVDIAVTIARALEREGGGA